MAEVEYKHRYDPACCGYWVTEMTSSSSTKVAVSNMLLGTPRHLYERRSAFVKDETIAQLKIISFIELYKHARDNLFS